MEQTLVTNKYIKAILEGDPAVLKELYYSFFPMIRNLVKENSSGSIEDAKDVFQDALAIIFDKASKPGFQLTAKFSTYIYGISRYLWLNQLKKKYRSNVTIPEDNTFMDESQLDLDYEALERRKLYDKYFAKLEEKCKRILLLFFSGTPMKIIAEKENLSNEANARKKKSRCQKHLTESIEKDPAYNELCNKL